MKKTFKQQVIELIASKDDYSPEELFNQALMLYNRSNKATNMRYYNRSGFSARRLESLLYDLQKAAEVSAIEIATYEAVSAAKKTDDTDQNDSDQDDSDNDVTSQDDQGKNDDDQAAAAVKEDYDRGVQVQQEMNYTPGELERELQEQPDEVKSGFKLITMYPFLDDDDCPNELKILVSDKMKAYRGFVAGSEHLSAILKGTDPAVTNEELYNLGGQLIEQWQLNEQIHEELTYYAEHKEILGNHPLLQELALKQGIADMDNTAANKRLKQVRTNITNNSKKLENARDEKAKAETQSRIDKYKIEEQLLNDQIEALKPADGAKE